MTGYSRLSEKNVTVLFGYCGGALTKEELLKLLCAYGLYIPDEPEKVPTF